MKSMGRSKNRLLGACLFFLYLAGLVYFLFFSENYGHGTSGTYSYNLIPFREILRFWNYRDVLGTRAVILNLLGNVIGFMPFGALLPVMVRGLRRVWRTVLAGFGFSVLVEVSQLIFQVGCFDVDDMILNTLGTFFGYLVFCLVYRAVRGRASEV